MCWFIMASLALMVVCNCRKAGRNARNENTLRTAAQQIGAAIDLQNVTFDIYDDPEMTPRTARLTQLKIKFLTNKSFNHVCGKLEHFVFV